MKSSYILKLLGHQGQVNRDARYGQAVSRIIGDQSALRLPIVLVAPAVLNGLLVPFRNRFMLRQTSMKVGMGLKAVYDGATIVFVKASQDCLAQSLQRKKIWKVATNDKGFRRGYGSSYLNSKVLLYTRIPDRPKGISIASS